MIFLSLRVTADAEGGLKGPVQIAPALLGVWGGSHQQACAGYTGTLLAAATFSKKIKIALDIYPKADYNSHCPKPDGV